MRPTLDEYFLKMARLVASRSTCLRRAVGCVLVNARGYVLATGYNGVARGQPHCNEELRTARLYLGLDERPKVSHIGKWIGPTGHEFEIEYPHACPAAVARSGTLLDGCEAIHAEQNALLQCRNAWEIQTCYCTASPCLTCVKLLLNTSCRRIAFFDEYPHPRARELWEASIIDGAPPRRRTWFHFEETPGA